MVCKGIPPKCPEFRLRDDGHLPRFLNQKRAACWGPEAGHGSHLHFFGPGKTSRWCRRKWVGWVFPRTLWMEVSRDVCLQVGLGFVESFLWGKLQKTHFVWLRICLVDWLFSRTWGFRSASPKLGSIKGALLIKKTPEVLVVIFVAEGFKKQVKWCFWGRGVRSTVHFIY